MPHRANSVFALLTLALASPLVQGAETAPTSAPTSAPASATAPASAHATTPASTTATTPATRPPTTISTTNTATATAPAATPATTASALFNEKLQIPAEAQIAAAGKVVKETYSADYVKPLPATKVALARKLLSNGTEKILDAPSRYFLLKEAIDLASAAGDLNTATDAVDAMNVYFVIDYRKLKAQTLENVSRMVATLPHYAAGVGRQFLLLAENAMAEDNFADVERFSLRAAGVAREQRDPQMIRRAEQLLAAARLGMTDPERVVSARETLTKNPDDQLANSVVGKYLAFVKRDFDAGIPMLAKGFDPELKAPAAAEIKAKGDVEKLIAAADMWWELSGKLPKQEAQHGAIRQHLQEVYINLAPQLTGFVKAMAERRAADCENDGDADETITITRAIYGPSANGKNGADVTNIVRNMFKRDGTAIVHVTAEAFGDPSRGNFKKLFVTYNYHGKQREWDIPEGYAARLPRIPPEGIPASGPEFRIVEAVWGFDTTWIDVTAKARMFFKTPATQFKPDAKTLGVDLPLEKVKAFIIIYERGGKRFIKECKGSETISLDK